MLTRLIGLTVAVAAITFVTAAHAVQPETDAANASVGYIESLQNADGGFPAFGTESSPGSTLDAVFALVAAGVDPTTVTNGGESPADYLAAQADTYSVDAGGAAKLMLAIVVMDLDPMAFGGMDMPSVLEGHLAEDPSTGVYGLDLFDQALSILALTAAELPLRATAAQYLRSQQQADGGWEFADSFGSDSNTTAVALQALRAAGGDASERATDDALAYLATTQNDDGGFGFTATDDSDANSTALVIQALVAAGEDIDVGGPWERNGLTPMDALLSFQNAVTGAFQYAGADSPFATYQAVPALMLAPFPDLQTHLELEPTPAATAITTAAPRVATPQPVLPRAGWPGPQDDGSSMWIVAVLGVAGSIVVGATFVSRRR